jgi:hypothetical protein
MYYLVTIQFIQIGTQGKEVYMATKAKWTLVKNGLFLASKDMWLPLRQRWG